MGDLYKLTSPSGKSYIGITTATALSRWANHVRHATKSRARGPLYAAIRKYGPSAFVVDVLAHADTWESLCALELSAIAEHGTLSPAGYNLTAGGDGVVGMAPEAKQRHRDNTSTGTKAAWDHGDLRLHRAATFATAVFREKHAKATSLGTRAAYQDPSVRLRLVASRSQTEYREHVSDSMKKRWTNTVYRSSQVAKRRLRKPRSAESIAAQSEKMRILIADRKRQGTYWNNKGTK